MNNSINMLSPFVLYCQKVIPLAFDESMSYYECLCALYSYLKDTVVPAVNHNAEALEEVQKAMVELKDYVDHYFDNLDIQTEIDNKLDEMADSGELAQIIAQYLEMSFIFGFDTIADLKAGDNFVAGNIVRVLGKTSYATGDGAFYRVRALTVYDTIDDDEIVGLTNYPTLVAEKITDYYINEINEELDKRLKVYHIKTSDNFNKIQQMMNDTDPKILDFETGSYTFTDTFRLNANTTLLFNNSTLTFNVPTVIQDWTASHGFFNFEADDEFTGYDGNGNIELNGGTIIHGNCSFCHAKDIRIINMDFKECYNDHILEMCAIDGLRVENCILNGVTSNDDNKEYINMDNATYGGFPFFTDQNNPTYDNTGNRNWQIINNTFTVPASTYVGHDFIGSHGYVAGYYHENIIIKNNNFMDSMNMSIQLVNVKHIVIEDNYFYSNSNLATVTSLEGSHIRLRNYADDILIKNNVFENGYRVLETATTHVVRNDIRFIENTVKDFTTYTAELALINLFTADKTVIKGNSFLNFAVGCIRTNGVDANVSTRKYYIEDNTFETDISIDGGQVLIKGYDGFSYITHNTFRVYGANKPYLIALGSTSNKGVIANNDYNIEIITGNRCLFTSSYTYGYKEIKGIVLDAWSGSVTSLSDQTPSVPITDFTCLKLTLGNSLQTYSVELFGWNIAQANIDARTWAIAIGNGYAKLTVTAQGKLTYDANGTSVTLRQVQCYNYI